MFCSNCGKTLKGDVTACPHCKATVGESRFEGQPYTGAQIKTKPGEAVRLPANHTKTTYMGSKSALDQDVDARTTYRATNEQVYSYDDVDTPDEIYNEDVLNYDQEPEYDSDVEIGAEEAVFDIPAQEEAYDTEEAEAAESAAPSDQDYAAEAEEAFETEEEYQPEIAFDDEEEPEIPHRRERKSKKTAKIEEIDEDQQIIDQMDEAQLEELREALNPPKKKPRKAKAKKKTEDELLDEEAFEEIRARNLDLDDDGEVDSIMRKYEESGRYERAPQPVQPVKEEKEEDDQPKKEKKSVFGKKPVFSFLKKREENFDIEPEEAFDEIDDENAFNLNDLPEMEGEFVDDSEYQDVELTDEDLEGIELTEEDLEFDERRKKLSPKAVAIIKYALASILVVAVLVGVIMGLRYITAKTKKAPIDGVTYELYTNGIELMQYRASDAYSNDVLKNYDGLANSMLSITARISGDLDSIAQMLPEEPDLNDARFIAALKAIQSSINNSITSDMLAVSDTEMTLEQKESESAKRWETVRAMVTALSGATSNAQLDAIIKGERVEVIQQATPEPEPEATSAPTYTTLASGSEGMAVRYLQQRLADLGYLDSEIDGDFGKKTKTAVQLFQKDAGLQVTGIADENTQAALYSDQAPKRTK